MFIMNVLPVPVPPHRYSPLWPGAGFDMAAFGGGALAALALAPKMLPKKLVDVLRSGVGLGALAILGE